MRRRLALALVALVAALLAAELGLRWALFGDGAWVRAHFWELRRPERFFDWRSEDEYWLLRRALDSEEPTGPPGRHPELGWIDASLEPYSCLPRDGLADDARRLILLFGDSFARCMPEAGACFEELLERTPLGASNRLANLGVRGYGLDQVTLLAERVLPALSGRDPLVVVALFVDEDLDRCRLRLSTLPKPRFVLRSGALQLEAGSVPELTDFLEQHRLGPQSYLGRLLLRSVAPDAHRREIEALARAVLQRLDAALRAAGVEFFYLLLHGEPGSLAPVAGDWREPFLRAELGALGARWVDARAAFRAHAASGAGGEPFLRAGPSRGHFSALGNELASRALLAGLEGRFDGP